MAISGLLFGRYLIGFWEDGGLVLEDDTDTVRGWDIRARSPKNAPR